MTSEHGNFPLFGTKGEQVIVILYTCLNKGVEFFILHNINIGNFPLFGRFALKISVLSIYTSMQILLLKTKI